MGSVLDAPIPRVMNDTPGWLPVSKGHGQGGQTQGSINVARNRVTNDEVRRSHGDIHSREIIL